MIKIKKQYIILYAKNNRNNDIQKFNLYIYIYTSKNKKKKYTC